MRMPTGEQLGTIFDGGTALGLGPAELLRRFVDRGDEAAFAALVARHGPMVLATCRRILPDHADADDAFQATFLVLARKANAITDPDRLAPWLHGVARRVATKARGLAARRRVVGGESSNSDGDPLDQIAVTPPPADAFELRPILDEELARLPAKYRDPLVLCYLEGLTHDEAAGQLAWPVGTVRSRLAGGRDRLRSRLARRGYGPSATLPPSLPLVVASRPLQAATVRLVFGATSATVATPAAVVLARGVLTSMFLTKFQALTAMTATALAVAAVGVATARPQDPAAGQPDTPAVAVPAPTVAKSPQAEVDGIVSTLRFSQDDVLDRAARTLVGRAVVERMRIDLDALRRQSSPGQLNIPDFAAKTPEEQVESFDWVFNPNPRFAGDETYARDLAQLRVKVDAAWKHEIRLDQAPPVPDAVAQQLDAATARIKALEANLAGLKAKLAPEPASVSAPAVLPPAADSGAIPEPSFTRIDYSNPDKYLILHRSFGDPELIRRLAAPLRADSVEKTLDNIGHWIDRELKYDASAAYEYRNVDAACRAKVYGGCADHALVFVALARACGIPAIFVKTMDVAWIREFRAAGTCRSWNGHVFLEVFLNGRWRLLDATAMQMYDDYTPTIRILPGNRYAYDKGSDPRELILSSDWERWKQQTARYFARFDLTELPVGLGRDLAASDDIYIAADSPIWQAITKRCQALGYRVRYSFNTEYATTLPKVQGKRLIVTSVGDRTVPPAGEYERYLPISTAEVKQMIDRYPAGIAHKRLDDGTRVVLLYARDAAELIKLVQTWELGPED